MQEMGLAGLLNRSEYIGMLNLKGTNLESILGLPKTVVKYIIGDIIPKGFDEIEYKGTCDKERRYEAINAIRREWEEVSKDTMLDIARLAEKIIMEEAAQAQEMAQERGQEDTVFRFYVSYFKLKDTADKITTLIKNKYSISALERYLLNIYDLQGKSLGDALELLRDYSQMNVEMEQKYEKYPKSLVLYHDMTAKNYKFVASGIQKQKIQEQYNQNKYLEYEYGDFCIVIPKTADEIISEGNNLHHCVSSYIGKVANGRSIIAFLRHRDNKEHSLGTIEIKDNSIVQKRGLQNRAFNSVWNRFVIKWASARGLALD